MLTPRACSSSVKTSKATCWELIAMTPSKSKTMFFQVMRPPRVVANRVHRPYSTATENHSGTGAFGLVEPRAFECGCEGESAPAPDRHLCSQPVHFAHHCGVLQEAVAKRRVMATRLFCICRRIHEYSAQK